MSYSPCRGPGQLVLLRDPVSNSTANSLHTHTHLCQNIVCSKHNLLSINRSIDPTWVSPAMHPFYKLIPIIFYQCKSCTALDMTRPHPQGKLFHLSSSLSFYIVASISRRCCLEEVSGSQIQFWPESDLVTVELQYKEGHSRRAMGRHPPAK